MAYNVVNGCQQIFGALDFGNAKKPAQRQVYAVRLEEIAYTLEESGLKLLNQAKKSGKDADGNKFEYLDGEEQERASKILEQSAKVRMQAAKIRGLMEKDKVENPNKYKVAPNIIFTDDIAALDLYRQIEDTPYEDVTETKARLDKAKMMQLAEKANLVYLSPKQKIFMASRAKRKTLLAGRAFRKTYTLLVCVGLIAKLLPRAKFFLAGRTFKQLLEIVLTVFSKLDF